MTVYVYIKTCYKRDIPAAYIYNQQHDELLAIDVSALFSLVSFTSPDFSIALLQCHLPFLLQRYQWFALMQVENTVCRLNCIIIHEKMYVDALEQKVTASCIIMVYICYTIKLERYGTCNWHNYTTYNWPIWHMKCHSYTLWYIIQDPLTLDNVRHNWAVPLCV